MDKIKRRSNGTDFSNSIQQDRRRKEHSEWRKVNVNVTSIYKGKNKERERVNKKKKMTMRKQKYYVCKLQKRKAR